MTDVTELVTHHARGLQARQEFINERCAYFPPIILNLIPVSDNRRYLMDCLRQAEETWRECAEAYLREQNDPWAKTGKLAKLVKNEEYKGADLMTLGLTLDRMLGVPAPVKAGKGPDGEYYSDHPEVKDAMVNAHRTAEWVVELEVKKLRHEWQRASSTWVKVVNAEPDGAQTKQLKKVEAEAQRAYQKAEKQFNALRENPKKGLKIVRDALSDAAIQAERE